MCLLLASQPLLDFIIGLKYYDDPSRHAGSLLGCHGSNGHVQDLSDRQHLAQAEDIQSDPIVRFDRQRRWEAAHQHMRSPLAYLLNASTSLVAHIGDHDISHAAPSVLLDLDG